MDSKHEKSFSSYSSRPCCKKNLSQQGFEVIESNQSTPTHFIENMDVDAVLLMAVPFDAKIISKMSNLKIIARHGVGYDNVDLVAATQHGIIVTNTPGANATAVTETALMFLLMSGRQFYLKHETINADRQRELLPTLFGYELSNKTVGLIGYGNIGQKIAQLLNGFNVKLLVYAKHSHVVENGRMAELEEIYQQADFLILALPATSETIHMINHDTLAMMKKSVILVNVGRGQLIDEKALYVALKNDHIFAAGLDVIENEPVNAQNPLYKLPNVFLTHTATHSQEAKVNVSLEAAKEITRVLKGEQPKHPVNNFTDCH